MSEEGLQLLFVYGTLRRGSSHEMALWLAREAECLGEGEVQGRLVRVSYYPGLVAGENRVKGDVYRVRPELWQKLDAFEEVRGRVDDEYRREKVEVATLQGSLTAWVYWYQRGIEGLEVIEGGDWFEFSELSVEV